MLTTEKFEKAVSLLAGGYSYPDIARDTGMTTEEAGIVGDAYFKSEIEHLLRDLQLSNILELAAEKLRSGQGWDEGTTGDVLSEILHVYPSHVKKALALALRSGKL